MRLSQLDPRELEQCKGLVVLEGTYFHRQVTLAGKVMNVTLGGGSTYLTLRLTGTGDEDLLKFHTAQPQREIRAHVCGQGCNRVEVAEDLVHVQIGRPMKEAGSEEPWVTNLEKVGEREDDVDELAVLRSKAGMENRDRGPGHGVAPEEVRGSSPMKKKKVKKKEKKKKKKQKKESDPGKSEESEEGVRLDGTRPRQANPKRPKVLFAGTGLDPREKVRNRVARRARRHLRKRTEKSSSSGSQSGSQSSSSDAEAGAEEGIFEQGSKVRTVAEQFPGALSGQALRSMRATLLQEIGSEDKPGTMQAVAVAYFRQHLQRRAGGPTGRELMTLSHSIDQLLKGKVATAMDTMIQRVKSIEQGLAGTHWSVAQRQEVLPAETATLTAVPESSAAQKEIYQEAKARWFAGFPQGTAPKGGKSTSKGKGDGKDRGGQGSEKDRKGGKGAGNKGDSSKKKET